MGPALALIAHDGSQGDMLEFAVRHARVLRRCTLVASDSTGRLLEEQLGLRVERLAPGPARGAVQVAARVVMGEVDAVVMLAGPLTSRSDLPTIRALLRVCNLHQVPVAANVPSADLLMDAMDVARSPAGIAR